MKLFHQKYINRIEQLANQMRTETMPSLTGDLFALFETTGNRLAYEEIYFIRRKFLAVFGMAAYIFQRTEDIVKLEEVLLDICKEECWALPAHVNRTENADWRNTVDLFASETAQALAEIVSLVDNISETVKENVRIETERRVFRPFELQRQGWECSDHNWNAVCCGSIGSAAIYLLAEKEDTRLERFLKRICHSLMFYIDGFRDDGACMEGIGYFTYGMTYFTGFAEQLLRYSKGSINLFNNEKIRKIAQFQQKMFFSSGQTVSFSDGDTCAKFRMGLTVFLADRYESVCIPGTLFAADFETDPCYRFMGLMRDYRWTKDVYTPDGKDGCATGKTADARHDIFPQAEWSICESSAGTGFAIKGGHNGEPHNHNDIGSFFYLVNTEQLLCDLGAGEYTAAYFGPERYSILCNSSEGHNVPLINGLYQKAGVCYKASFFEADGKGKTRIEFSDAYGKDTINKLLRETDFSLETGRVCIRDEFEAATGMFTENLVTKGNVILQENAVQIQGKAASCKIQIDGKTKNLRVLERNHSNHEGESETIRLIQWEVIPEKHKGEKGEEQYHGVSKYTIWQL